MRKTGEHRMVNAGGNPVCATCGADQDDAFVGGSKCSFVAPKFKFPYLHFGEITNNLTKLIARDDETFTVMRKLLGLTPKQFEFYLDNLEGVRKVEDEDETPETCNNCGSGLIRDGECQKCGL
jgi:hypothetical protein